MKRIVLTAAWLVLAAITLSAAEPRFRTDINPALRYYQSYLEAPKLDEADHQYLFVNDWRGKPLDEKFGQLIARYDYQFRILREAVPAEAPCDWGIDLTEGPDALLTGLAPAKVAAQVARLRVMWHLQHGRQEEARKDLVAAFVLGRRLSRDGVLISALVQIAIENIIGSIVAENFHRWEPATLSKLIEELEGSPARGTIAQCVRAEKLAFHDWLLRKAEETRKESAGNEALALAGIRSVLARTADDSNAEAGFADRVIGAAGGTSEGVVRLIRELEPFYDRVAELMTLPHGPFETGLTTFMAEVRQNANPLVPKLFVIFEKCRAREFARLTNLAMLRAAAVYKLEGESGLKNVKDPVTGKPFAFRRFVFEGEDRGFELKSDYEGRGHKEVLIFVEKDGPLFRIDGMNAGEAIPKVR
jgi:hypothetical protein